MSEVLSWIFGSYANKDWWFLNKESIALALLVTAMTAVVWPILHELTKAAIAKLKK